MDRKESKKFKKEKSVKCSSKKEGPLYITDVKSFKENIKIKEILRNVKMNSSMRLKAPPGSKVMSNTDFNYEDSFEESSVAQNSTEILSATNTDVVVSNVEPNESKADNNYTSEASQESDTANESNAVVGENNHSCNHISTIEPLSTGDPTLQTNCDNIQSDNENVNSNLNNRLPNGKMYEKTRDRKLSLDQTILSRREGLSQSELDLHSIGKSPLERKSSFFKKTMDSFVKNTTEMFKKQNKSLQRHVSMSVSLQSLNDKSTNPNDYREVPIQE
ncbi:jg3078, partial [Pararge aegeria aegeria]